MALDFYYGSGSPYAWRVWLALEHKAVPYALKMVSFDKREHHAPEFLAMNPRHRVPVIKDDGFALYESAAILEYLDERFASATPEKALFPKQPQARAVVRRLVREADQYVATALEHLVEKVLFTPKDRQDATAIKAAADALAEELGFFERALGGDYLAGALSAADLTLYPMVALALRMEKRNPALGLDLGARLGPKLGAWSKRVEALPYFDKTYPPHWR